VSKRGRVLLKVGIGLIGVSTLAAVVVPKTTWEALIMEVSSNHNAKWQRNAATGQLVATGDKAPDQSYKPILPDPQPLQSSPPKSLPNLIGEGDIVGTWRVEGEYYLCDPCSLHSAGMYTVVVNSSLQATTECDDRGTCLQNIGTDVPEPEQNAPGNVDCVTGPSVQLIKTVEGTYTQKNSCVAVYGGVAGTVVSNWKFVVEGAQISGTYTSVDNRKGCSGACSVKLILQGRRVAPTP
jgi:hypothetical protein